MCSNSNTCSAEGAPFHVPTSFRQQVLGLGIDRTAPHWLQRVQCMHQTLRHSHAADISTFARTLQQGYKWQLEAESAQLTCTTLAMLCRAKLSAAQTFTCSFNVLSKPCWPQSNAYRSAQMPKYDLDQLTSLEPHQAWLRHKGRPLLWTHLLDGSTSRCHHCSAGCPSAEH